MSTKEKTQYPEYSAFNNSGFERNFNFKSIFICCIMLLVLSIIIPFSLCLSSAVHRTETSTLLQTLPSAMEMGANLVYEKAEKSTDAQTLAGALDVLSISKSAKYCIVDSTGKVVGAEATDATAEQLRAAAAAKASGAESIKLGDTPTMLAYAPIGSTGYTLVALAPQNDLVDSSSRKTARNYAMAMCAWGIIFGIFGLWASLPKLTIPLHRLLPEIDRISSGDFSGEVPDIGTSYKEFLQLHDSVYLLKRNTNRVISDISSVLGEMAQGNFVVQSETPESYVGDYQAILTAAELIRDQLCGALTEINDVSEQVSSGSEQVSNGAQTLAQGATEQASSVEELSATTADVARQIKSNAEFVEQASTLTRESGEIMSGTMQAMSEAKAAMDEISETSNNISKVIKAIDDIAFQTNILALNAAVEAARAGAAGKGFAVVADEVRNLSQKSAEAAKNTTALIESSIEAVGKGNRLVDKATSDFEVVVEKSGKINEIVNSVSEQFRQQAVAANQISQGIEQVASVIQMNSATSEESAAASQELSGQANILKELVSQFRLEIGEML